MSKISGLYEKILASHEDKNFKAAVACSLKHYNKYVAALRLGSLLTAMNEISSALCYLPFHESTSELDQLLNICLKNIIVDFHNAHKEDRT